MKDKNPYPACQIYKGTCVCDETYIGETIRNVDIRWNEHEDIRKKSEPAKHLRENLNLRSKWETLLQAPKSYQQRKNLEAYFIAIIGPTLSNQLEKALSISQWCHLRIFQLIVNCINLF